MEHIFIRRIGSGEKLTVVIGHIALIQRSKRQDFVLDVLKALKKKGYDVIGLFIGGTREEDFLAELQKQVQINDMESCAVFLG